MRNQSSTCGGILEAQKKERKKKKKRKNYNNNINTDCGNFVCVIIEIICL